MQPFEFAAQPAARVCRLRRKEANLWQHESPVQVLVPEADHAAAVHRARARRGSQAVVPRAGRRRADRHGVRPRGRNRRAAGPVHVRAAVPLLRADRHARMLHAVAVRRRVRAEAVVPAAAPGGSARVPPVVVTDAARRKKSARRCTNSSGDACVPAAAAR